MSHLGIDIGGTFTDVVLTSDSGAVSATKVPSTPPNFERGFMSGIAKIAGMHGQDPERLLRSSDLVLHGTTVATNALVEMRGARIGVITTQGHRDTLRVMRASGRAKGLSVGEMLHASSQSPAQPVADIDFVLEVAERVDAGGEVVVPLDDAELARVARGLIEQGAQAFAVCFLWAVANPAHERRAKEIIQRLAPGMFVTCSHEVSSRPGEYERFAATAINAYLGPETAGYLTRVREEIDARGGGSLLIMQATGGVASDARAASLPVLTIGSGPSAGVAACATLALRRGDSDVITTDMGGTSFDVALIAAGEVIRSASTIVNRYEFFLPRADIRSIGSGGGSIIHFDPGSRTLRVGPMSAGADPGPACYSRGGVHPTITDANLVLGVLNPDNFLGGDMPLDVGAAERALASAGTPLGLDAVEVATASVRIVEAQMSELIRQMTVERGFDPREFTVYAYGGGGGLHAAASLRELGCPRVLLPLGSLASTWSAFGCASSDVLHVYEQALHLASPFDVPALTEAFADLEARAARQLDEDNIPPDRRVYIRELEMKYPLQIHRVSVSIGNGELEDGELAARFHEQYERLYGGGSGLVGSGVEITTCRVVARGRLTAERDAQAVAATESDPVTSRAERAVMWPHAGAAEAVPTQVVDARSLAAGVVVVGPAVIEAPTTTVAVPPGTKACMEADGIVLELA
jgi:N-methylhydantoinase A